MCDQDLTEDYVNAIQAVEKRLEIETKLEVVRELRLLLSHFKTMQEQRKLRLEAKNLPSTNVIHQAVDKLPVEDNRRRRQSADVGAKINLGGYQLEARIHFSKIKKGDTA